MTGELWGSFRNTTYQRHRFDIGDHAEFDDNTGVLTVTGGSGQAKGKIQVPGGSPDIQFTGTIYLSIPPSEPDNAFITYQWYDHTLDTYIGTEGTYSLSPTAENTEAIANTYAPASDREYSLRIINRSGNITSVTGTATATQTPGATGGGGGVTPGAGIHVFAEYMNLTDTVVPSASEVIVSYAVQLYDSHDSVETSPDWKFTAQYDGAHYVRASTGIEQWTQVEDEFVELRLYRNGFFYCVLDSYKVFLPSVWSQDLKGDYAVNLSVGDQLSVKLFNGTASPITIVGDSKTSRISVVRLKN